MENNYGTRYGKPGSIPTRAGAWTVSMLMIVRCARLDPCGRVDRPVEPQDKAFEPFVNYQDLWIDLLQSEPRR